MVPCSTSSRAAAVQPGHAQQLDQPLPDGTGVVVDGGGHLQRVDGTFARDQDEVGEGAADVDADAGPAGAHGAAPGGAQSTGGVSVQPRAVRSRSRSAAVATSSTARLEGSITTP